MIGRVHQINPVRGMVAVETAGYGYSIFEMLSEEPVSVGDEVEWSHDTVLGRTVLVNHTVGASFDVYFQNHWVPPGQLRVQLRL